MDPLAIPGAIPVDHADDISSDGSPITMLDGQDDVLFDARDFDVSPSSEGRGKLFDGSDSEADEQAQHTSETDETHQAAEPQRNSPVHYDAEEFEGEDDLPLDPPAGVTIDEWARLRRLRLMSKAHVHDGDKVGLMDNVLTATCVFLVWGSMLLVLLNLACLAATGSHMPGVAASWSLAQDAVARTWSFTRQPLHTHMMPVFDPEYAATLPSDQGLYESYMHGSPKQRRKIVETFTEGSVDARDMALLTQQRREDAMQQHRWSLDGSAVVSSQVTAAAATAEFNTDGIDSRLERYKEMVRKRREKVSLWPPPHAQAAGAHPFARAEAAERQPPTPAQQEPVLPQGSAGTAVAPDGSTQPIQAHNAAQIFMARRLELMNAGLPADIAEQVAAKELQLAEEGTAH